MGSPRLLSLSKGEWLGQGRFHRARTASVIQSLNPECHEQKKFIVQAPLAESQEVAAERKHSASLHPLCISWILSPKLEFSKVVRSCALCKTIVAGQPKAVPYHNMVHARQFCEETCGCHSSRTQWRWGQCRLNDWGHGQYRS